MVAMMMMMTMMMMMMSSYGDESDEYVALRAFRRCISGHVAHHTGQGARGRCQVEERELNAEGRKRPIPLNLYPCIHMEVDSRTYTYRQKHA